MSGAVGFLYPASRGVDTETDNTAPCGGFELGGRTEFPLSTPSLSISLLPRSCTFSRRSIVLQCH